MSEADALLKSLLAVEEPPERDAAFALAVMERIAKRRFWFEVLMMVPAVLAACVALWALAPLITELAVRWLGPVAEGALLPVLFVVGTLAGLALMGGGREGARA